MATRKPWYEKLFERDYYDYFYVGGPRGLLAEARSDAQVDFLVDALAVPDGARILDLCCGHGRHAVRLAERGYRVTGLDLSAYHLRLGARAARERHVEVEWLRADMREVPGHNRFDGIVNLFTAFGYFDQESEDQLVIDRVARALKPGGRFLVDLMNRDGLMGRFRESGCSRGPEGGYVAEMRDFDVRTGRINVSMLFFPKEGRPKRHWHSIRLYTCSELEALMANAGLRVTQTWGNYDGSAFRLQSPRMMVMAEKGN
jgi:SAM-dependent methyltransferase